jgi:glycosyltransferase involved in cell wall biosynthesis
VSERPGVLLLTPHFPPAQGGIADYAHWLTKELADQGFDMRVITSQFAGEAAAKRSEGAREIYVSRTVEHWDRRLWRSVADEVSSFKPDILHIQYQHVMYGGDPAIGFLPWALAARRMRPAIVTTLHDMAPPSRGPKAARRLAFESLLYGSRKLIVSNDSEFEGLARRPGIRQRANVVSVGSNIPLHTLPPEERVALRASLSRDRDGCLLVFFGLIRPGKGIEAVIDAVADLRHRSVPVELLVVGDIGDSESELRVPYRDQLIERQLAIGVEDAVHFLGHQSEENVSRLLQACDLAVLPFNEGASANRTTILAALSHGLPLVTTRGVGTPAMFSDGAMAFVPSPPDAKRLSASIEDLIKQPEKRDAMARRGRQLADRFTHTAIGQQVAGIYEELLLPRTS